MVVIRPNQRGGTLQVSVGERHVLLEGLAKLDFGFGRDVERKLRDTMCDDCGGSGFAPYVGGEDDEDPCERCGGTGSEAPTTGGAVNYEYQGLAQKARESARFAMHQGSPIRAREWLEVAVLADAARQDLLSVARSMYAARETPEEIEA